MPNDQAFLNEVTLLPSLEEGTVFIKKWMLDTWKVRCPTNDVLAAWRVYCYDPDMTDCDSRFRIDYLDQRAQVGEPANRMLLRRTRWSTFFQSCGYIGPIPRPYQT